MRTEHVSCDGCGADLTRRSNSVDYRLVLDAESKPGHGPGFYTAMAISPAVDRAYHFCGLTCLDHWRSREHHSAELSRKWWDAWREKHGTKHEGRVYSYPTPPRFEVEEANAECQAAALEAFPMARPKADRG